MNILIFRKSGAVILKKGRKNLVRQLMANYQKMSIATFRYYFTVWLFFVHRQYGLGYLA